MHLVLGRTGQEYNNRKKRLGAYWEDRYHATAIESGVHLIACMVYIDTNMVRARVVEHPKDWPFCGFQEISGRRKRYCLIRPAILSQCVGMNIPLFRKKYARLIEAYIKKMQFERENKWTESLAVGSKEYVEQLKLELGMKARSRLVTEHKGMYSLEEPKIPYNPKRGGKNSL